MLRRITAVVATLIALFGSHLFVLGLIDIVEGLSGSSGGTDTQPSFAIVVGVVLLSFGAFLLFDGIRVARRSWQPSSPG